MKVTEHKYGKVVWIQNNQGNKYAAHFWVQRPAGWRLLHIAEIEQRPAEPGDVRPNYPVACDNPCNEIPYKALTQNEKDAIRALGADGLRRSGAARQVPGQRRHRHVQRSRRRRRGARQSRAAEGQARAPEDQRRHGWWARRQLFFRACGTLATPRSR